MVSRASDFETGQLVDVLAVGRDGRPVLVVEVKVRPHNTDDTKAQLWQAARSNSAPFALLATEKKLTLFRVNEKTLDLICEFDTLHVLSHYDPSLDLQRPFPDYVESLLQAWLRDLAYNWKSAEPPALTELRGAGLAQLLEGGDASSEVRLGRDPLS